MSTTRSNRILALLSPLLLGAILLLPATADAMARKIVEGTVSSDLLHYQWAYNLCVQNSEGLAFDDRLDFLTACCGQVHTACTSFCDTDSGTTDAGACRNDCGFGLGECRHGRLFYYDWQDGQPASFDRPVVEEIRPSPRVDYCLDGDSGCGAPAAHRVCQRALGPDFGARAFAGDGVPATLEDHTWQLDRWYPRQPYGTGQGFDFVECEPLEGRRITFTDVPGDSDQDGVADASDNCPAVPNPLQNNFDGDPFGDHCDLSPYEAYACSNGIDDDGDGFADADDPGCLAYDDDSEGPLGLDDGLVGHWPLDGDANDLGVYGLHGTNVGAVPAPDLDGQAGAALAFDGAGFIDLGADPMLKPALPVTISALVRPACMKMYPCTIFTNDADPSLDTGITLQIGSIGWLEARYGDGGPRGTASRRRASTPPVLTDGAWHHVAVVIHGPTDFRFFVDGAQIDRADVLYDGTGGDLAYSSQSGLIGVDFPFDTFEGALDEVRFYERALTPSEIAALDPRYCVGADDLLGRWDLEGDARDASGCGNHGVVSGATPTTDVLGERGAAYAFDGDDAIDLGRAGVLKPELPATLFLRMRSECPVGDRCFAFENDADPDRYSGISLQVGPEGRLELRMGDGGPQGPGYRRSAITDAPLVPGRWHDVAAVIRGPRDVEIFVDGVQQSVDYSGSGGPMAYLGGPALIGSHGFGTNPFQGGLDDIRLFDRALSPTEIVALPEPGGAAGLLLGLGGLATFSRSRRSMARWKGGEGEG
jgi:hypothetical protein